MNELLDSIEYKINTIKLLLNSNKKNNRHKLNLKINESNTKESNFVAIINRYLSINPKYIINCNFDTTTKDFININSNIKGNIQITLLWKSDLDHIYGSYNIKINKITNFELNELLEKTIYYYIDRNKEGRFLGTIFFAIFNNNSYDIIPKYSNNNLKNTYKLNNNDIIYTYSNSAIIYIYQNIDELIEADKYSKQIKQNYESIRHIIKGRINVKGDGNCYYRAVLYSVFITILFGKNKNIQYIKYIKSKFKEDVFIDFFNSLENINYIDFMKLYMTYDMIFIEKCKRLMLEYIKENIKYFINVYDERFENSSLLEFSKEINDILMKRNECIQGIISGSHILPFLLGCKESTIYIMYSNQPIYQEHGVNKISHNTLPNVHILLNPGHYSIFIPQDF